MGSSPLIDPQDAIHCEAAEARPTSHPSPLFSGGAPSGEKRSEKHSAGPPACFTDSRLENGTAKLHQTTAGKNARGRSWYREILAENFLNKDLYIGRRVLEIGTASLRNYLYLATEWFQLDLSAYNFFLMPISFYHGFETAEPASRAHYPEQVQKLLAYLDSLEEEPVEAEAKQHVALRLETKLVRGKDARSVAFRWTDDPSAPAITVREEDIFKNYPLTYRDLADKMKRRYEHFLENKVFHKLRQALEKESKYAIVRLLHPSNPRSARQRFYNANILQEFDKHYTRRTKS